MNKPSLRKYDMLSFIQMSKHANVSYILYKNIQGKAIIKKKSKEMLSTKFKIIDIPGSSGGRGMRLEITTLDAS